MTQEEILALPKRKFLIWLRNFVGLIPKEQWCTGVYTSEDNHHCIMGWIYKEYDSRIADKVRNITNTLGFSIVLSNDGHHNSDLRIQKLNNPKDRVLKHINLKLANKI